MALIGTTALLCGCSSGSTKAVATARERTTLPPTPTSPPAVAQLRHDVIGEVPGGEPTARPFVATGLSVDGQPQPFVDGRDLVVAFSNGRFSAIIHCVTLTEAAYDITDDSLLALSDFDRFATMAPAVPDLTGCERPEVATEALAQDQALTEMIRSTPSVSFADDTLTIASAHARVTFIDLSKAPLPPIAGTRWVATGLAYERGGHAVGPSTAVTLSFSGDGSVAITVGCHAGSAHVVIDGSTMTFSGYHLSTNACTDGPTDATLVPTLTEVGRWLRSLFDGPVDWNQNTAVLQLSAADSTSELDQISLYLEGT